MGLLGSSKTALAVENFTGWLLFTLFFHICTQNWIFNASTHSHTHTHTRTHTNVNSLWFIF